MLTDACQFPAMIYDWRRRFAEPWAGTDQELTFLFVGLPAYVQDLPSTSYDGEVDSGLPQLRLAQVHAEGLGHTFMTSLIDHGYLFGHMGSIHPMDKTPVGKRLALAARQHVYGEAVVAAGPRPLSATVNNEGTRVALTFDPKTVGPDGLLLRTAGAVRQQCPLGQKQIAGSPTNFTVPLSQCGPATGFEFAIGAHGHRHWRAVSTMELGADRRSLELLLPARLADAKGLSVSSLRYLFADWPTPTVYNSLSYLGENGELPTAPFEMAVHGHS